MPLGLLELTMYQKRIQGAIYGMMSPSKDVPRLLDLWRSGQLRLEPMLTRTYSLDDINQGYADMHAGINMRGVLIFDQPGTPSAQERAAEACGAEELKRGADRLAVCRGPLAASVGPRDPSGRVRGPWTPRAARPRRAPAVT